MPADTLDLQDAARRINSLNSPASPVVQDLQKLLANSLVLFLNYKHYHWQVSGPLFRSLHLLFDDFSSQTEKSLDELAERIRMIGQDPVFAFEDIQRNCTIQPARSLRNLREMLLEADRNAIRLIAEMRDAAHVADQSGDPGTVDLLSSTLRMHEKHEWYLRELLKSNDGLLGPAPDAAA